MQAQDILGMKARQTLIKYIHDGQLTAIVVGGEDASKRYAVKGEDLILFKEKYDSGELKTEKYSVERMKMVLNAATKYCKENNIKTLEEFVISVNKLKCAKK